MDVPMSETIRIRLVSSSALDTYEVFSLLTSILSSAVVGFAVAFLQADEGDGAPLLWSGVVFLALMIVCGRTALRTRRALRRQGTLLRFPLGDPETVQRPAADDGPAS
jgi:hypothetical protein